MSVCTWWILPETYFSFVWITRYLATCRRNRGWRVIHLKVWWVSTNQVFDHEFLTGLTCFVAQSKAQQCRQGGRWRRTTSHSTLLQLLLRVWRVLAKLWRFIHGCVKCPAQKWFSWANIPHSSPLRRCWNLTSLSIPPSTLRMSSPFLFISFLFVCTREFPYWCRWIYLCNVEQQRYGHFCVNDAFYLWEDWELVKALLVINKNRLSWITCNFWLWFFVSEDVMENGFFYADCCGWSLVKWHATIWLLPNVWFFSFYFILVVGCFLLTTLYWVCNFKGFGLTASLDSYCMVFMVYWSPWSIGAVRTLILTRIPLYSIIMRTCKFSTGQVILGSFGKQVYG